MLESLNHSVLGFYGLGLKAWAQVYSRCRLRAWGLGHGMQGFLNT